MDNDMDNYNHDKTCGECFDEDCPSRLTKKDDRADLRCFTEAPRPQDSLGSAEFALLGCTKCGEKWQSNKYKDALELDGYYFTVQLVACTNCGRVNDKDSYIE